MLFAVGWTKLVAKHLVQHHQRATEGAQAPSERQVHGNLLCPGDSQLGAARGAGIAAGVGVLQRQPTLACQPAGQSDAPANGFL